MKTNFAPNLNARAFKTMWLTMRETRANAGPAEVAACHGNSYPVRRAGRSMSLGEIQRLIPQLTERGGGRDGSVQPGLLGNSYGI